MFRVCHGFGVTRGIWVTGVMVTGAVSNFRNRDHTAHRICGVTSVRRVWLWLGFNPTTANPNRVLNIDNDNHGVLDDDDDDDDPPVHDDDATTQGGTLTRQDFRST